MVKTPPPARRVTHKRTHPPFPPPPRSKVKKSLVTKGGTHHDGLVPVLFVIVVDARDGQHAGIGHLQEALGNGWDCLKEQLQD